MSIYFVRHGETDWNKNGFYQGRSDIELNATGKAQAKDSKALLKDVKIDKIYHSPLSRAKETALIINELYNLEMQEDERLSERCFGDMEGKHVSMIAYDELWAYQDTPPCDGAEDLVSFFKRVEAFLDDIIEESQTKDILIVAHGGVSIPYQCYFQGMSNKDNLKSMILKNCEVSKMDGRKKEG